MHGNLYYEFFFNVKKTYDVDHLLSKKIGQDFLKCFILSFSPKTINKKLLFDIGDNSQS